MAEEAKSPEQQSVNLTLMSSARISIVDWMSFQPPFRIDFVRNARLEAVARVEYRAALLAADDALRGLTGVRCGFYQITDWQ